MVKKVVRKKKVIPKKADKTIVKPSTDSEDLVLLNISRKTHHVYDKQKDLVEISPGKFLKGTHYHQYAIDGLLELKTEKEALKFDASKLRMDPEPGEESDEITDQSFVGEVGDDVAFAPTK